MCTCQNCQRKYKVDFIVDNELWEKIKPEGKPEGAGMLCGMCIALSIEEMSGYDCYEVKRGQV